MRSRIQQPRLRVGARLIVLGLLTTVAGVGVSPTCSQQESADSQAGAPLPERKTFGSRTAQTGNVWRKPRTDEAGAERRKMVERQIKARGVSDPAVLEAMRNVPRQWFVPAHLRNRAYRDGPLPIGEGQTISQPYIVALMTEALHLTSDSKVLEIGTGSGYQAAVLSEITPHVFTIDIVEPLARRAIAAFEQHGYETIRTRIGDGYAGWPEHAPFDAIIVTCAPDHIPPKLIEQLKPGGRICIPIGDEHAVQRLLVVTTTASGAVEQKELIPVRFVPMTGAAREQSSGG